MGTAVANGCFYALEDNTRSTKAIAFVGKNSITKTGHSSLFLNLCFAGPETRNKFPKHSFDWISTITIIKK